MSRVYDDDERDERKDVGSLSFKQLSARLPTVARVRMWHCQSPVFQLLVVRKNSGAE